MADYFKNSWADPQQYNTFGTGSDYANAWSAENWQKTFQELDEPDPQSGGGSITPKKRPSWKDVYDGYPQKNNVDTIASIVFKSVFGDEYDENNKELIIKTGNQKETRIPMDNACATRISIALNHAGFPVKGDFIGKMDEMSGKGIITSAIKLKNWLSKKNVFGSPDFHIDTKDKEYASNKGKITLKDLQMKIGIRNGIYIIIPYPGCFSSATGHATLWVAKQADVTEGHNYAQCIGEICFWELV